MSVWDQELTELVKKEAATKLVSEGAPYRKRIWEILTLQREIQPWLSLQ